MFQKWQQCIEAARKECEKENWQEAEKHLATAVAEAERFGYNNTRLSESLCKPRLFVKTGAQHRLLC